MGTCGNDSASIGSALSTYSRITASVSQDVFAQTVNQRIDLTVSVDRLSRVAVALGALILKTNSSRLE
jgi:hypothetical protein